MTTKHYNPNYKVGLTQALGITGSSAATANGHSADIRDVRIVCTVDAYVEFGSNPTATTNSAIAVTTGSNATLTNSIQSEVVINNDQSRHIDYVKLATVCAKLIKKHMVNNHITLMTDEDVDDPVFDNVVSVNPNGLISSRALVGSLHNDIWINGNRPDVYEVSPYKNTLLLDVDYFVFNNSLDALFGSIDTFCFHDKVYDCADSKSLESLKAFGHYKMPHHWATVLYFTKCKDSEALFTAMKMIRDNWKYYRKFFRIHESR